MLKTVIISLQTNLLIGQILFLIKVNRCIVIGWDRLPHGILPARLGSVHASFSRAQTVNAINTLLACVYSFAICNTSIWDKN